MMDQVNRQVGERPHVDDRRRGRARPPVRAATAASAANGDTTTPYRRWWRRWSPSPPPRQWTVGANQSPHRRVAIHTRPAGADILRSGDGDRHRQRRTSPHRVDGPVAVAPRRPAHAGGRKTEVPLRPAGELVGMVDRQVAAVAGSPLQP